MATRRRRKKVSSGDEQAEAVSAELDEQCAQAQARDADPGPVKAQPPYRPGDIAKSVAQPQRVAPGPAVDVGDTITVVWGEEKFSPVQYNSFAVGGSSVTVRVRQGESPKQAHDRAWRMLESMAADEVKAKTAGFVERLKEVNEQVRAARS
jgi:hypothetical protein